MIVTERKKGLAGLFSNTDTELVSYCGGSYLNYLTGVGCWDKSYEYWKGGGLPTPVAPLPPSDALSNPTGSYYDSGALAEQLSNDAISTTQGNVRSFFDSFVSSVDKPNSGCNWLGISCGMLMVGALVAVGGIVVLGDSGPKRYGR